MKNIIYLILCVSFTFLNSQVEEGNTVRLQFIKVEEDKVEEFESYMIEYVGPAAKAAVSEGKMENWLEPYGIRGLKSLHKTINITKIPRTLLEVFGT